MSLKLKGEKTLLSLPIVVLLVILLSFSYISSIFAIDEIEYYPLKVSDVKTMDSDMNSIKYFSRPDVININITVEKPLNYISMGDPSGITDFNLLITVIDPNGKPIYFNIVNYSLSLGESDQYTFSFTTSLDFDVGTYNVKVMVWKDAGIPLADSVGEAEFNVL